MIMHFVKIVQMNIGQLKRFVGCVGYVNNQWRDCFTGKYVYWVKFPLVRGVDDRPDYGLKLSADEIRHIDVREFLTGLSKQAENW